MGEKLEEIVFQVFAIIYYIILLLIPLILVYKCSTSLVNRIQNPPSKIYGENQLLGKWNSFCIEWIDEDYCSTYGSRLKSKSTLYSNDAESDILTIIEIDEYETYLTITLKDWITGEIIDPYPQEKNKWYQFFKNYDSYDSVGYLFGDDSKEPIGYELTIFKDEIVISENSCDSRGYEELDNVKGGCFFLEKYTKELDEWHFLLIELDDGRGLDIHL